MAKKAAKSDAPATTSKDYTVLARRYRPQQFDDLVGQEAVVQALKNGIQSGRIAHAYLFTGVRGVGKTSLARILAKALNCINGPTITPCDQCSNCNAIAVGEDIDVLEIDGASNNKVEEVRELRQNTQYRPQSSRFKIYIIDEVHMLTTSAFNALLKTLEEPPPHVKFIFATTEVNKIPITILSRCQRYDLTGIPRDRIKQRLQEIVKQEKQEAEDTALALIARRAGGSMRDAQSLLDQVLAFAQGKLTLEQVQSLLGLAKDEQILNLVLPILERDPAKALPALHQTLGQGVQPAELLDQWIDLWRQLLLVATLGDSQVSRDLIESDITPLKAALANWKPEGLMAGLDVLVTTKSRLRMTGHGQVLMELALIRLCRLADLVPLAEVARKLDGLAKGASRGAPMPSASRVTPPHPAPPLSGREPIPQAIKSSDEVEPNGVASSSFHSGARIEKAAYTLDSPRELWSALLDNVSNHFRFQLESAVQQKFIPPSGLMVGFPPGCEIQKDFCSESTRLGKMEETLRKLTGQSVSLRFEIIRDAAPVAKSAPKAVQQKQVLQQMPLARAIMEQLGGQLVSMDDGFGENLPQADPDSAGDVE
jgi:DNA polymerase III subunit gamma/tau